MSEFNRIWKFIKPYGWQLLAGFGCTFFAAATLLFVPGLLQTMVYKIMAGNYGYINTFLILGLVILFVRAIAIYGQTYFQAYVGQKVMMDLRNEIFSHLTRMSFSFYTRWRTGELISRIVNDIDLIQSTFINYSLNMFLCGLTGIGLLYKMFDLSWQLTLIVCITVPAVGFAMSKFGEQIKKITGKVQAKIADISSLIQETISGIRSVKSFSREDYEVSRFGKEGERNFKISMERTRIEAIQEPVIEILAFLGILFVIWFGVRCIVAKTLDIGKAIAFTATLFLIRDPVVGLSRAYGHWQQAFAAANRIFEVMDMQEEKSGGMSMPLIRGEIEFKEVYFGYEPDKPVLKDINIHISPGEVIALVGPVGAGKSTLTNLIPRFYEPDSGSIYIDGVNIKDVQIDSLRRQIGIVPQDVVLFSGTIKENIRYGRLDATDEEIVQAAKLANAHDFILKFPHHYESPVGEKGVMLSGGQRQCIAIARVLLKNPRIILLDEATSSLDSETEYLLQNAVASLIQGRTTIIIAHRLSTVRHADRIIVMDKGRIVETGTHSQLMANKGLYYKLYEMQFQPLEKTSIENKEGLVGAANK